MSLHIADPSHSTPVSHNINIGFPVRGFLVLPYSWHDPSRLEPPPTPAPEHVPRVSVAPDPVPPGKP
jgi:hypothetical protein